MASIALCTPTIPLAYSITSFVFSPNDGNILLNALSALAAATSALRANPLTALFMFLNGAVSLSTAVNIDGMVKAAMFITSFLFVLLSPHLPIQYHHTKSKAPENPNYLKKAHLLRQASSDAL